MTTTNQNSVNNENQQKNTSSSSSGNNHNQQQQQSNVTATTKITKVLDSSNNISTSNNNSNLVKLQSLKLRKFELEQLLNEKTKLLQQIQNQESEIITNGCNNPIADKTNLHGNNTNNSTSSSLRRNTENNSFKNRKSIFPTSEQPLKSSSLKNFDVYSTKDDVNDTTNKSDLLSVSSFNSENSKTKTKEKLWFDSTLDSPLMRVDTPNHSNNMISNISTNSNNSRPFCQQQRTSSTHHTINSPTVITQTAGIYQLNSNKLSNINAQNPSQHNHNFNQYSRNNHLHYVKEINSNSPKLLSNDSFLTFHDQTKKLPANSSNNFPITNINSGDPCVNNNYNFYNRYKNHRDRLKLSSQSMSSGSNNYYKMQVIKLEDLSYLSLSTSVLNGKTILNDENSSSESTQNKVKKFPTKNLVPNKMEMNLHNLNLNECSIQNLQVNNVIHDSGLPPVPQIYHNPLKNKNDISYKNTIKQQNIPNSSYFMERFSSDVDKSSTLPIFNNSEISFSKPLTPPPRNVILEDSGFSPISAYQCSGGENSCWHDADNFQLLNNANVKTNMQPFQSNNENHHVIPITKTIKLSSSSPSPPPLSTTLGITSLPGTVLATNKTILSTSPEFRMESPKNVTVVQQATFMPYKEVSKPFEMSDFYKYSTKFRQKDSMVSCFTNNNNNNKSSSNIINNNFSNNSSSSSNNISNNKNISGNLNSNINTNVQKLLNP